MPRLFTGLDISDEAADALLSVRGGLSGARWITPDNYHITLRFIGDVDDSVARDVFNILARISRKAIPITINGLMAFGKDRPRALVASVLPTPALMDLQAEHERLMRRIGLAPEPRKFTPHVTLARLRDTSAFELANFLGATAHFPAVQFSADAFNVFSSRDSVGGGPYVVEASYPLFSSYGEEEDRRSA